MPLFKYETHLHTKESSACARASGAEHVRYYKDAGYSGIFVTDHFFSGNSSIPRHLPWDKRIDLFCKGYENAKEEGDKIGLSVFFGLETNYNGAEFLIYGVDKEWLKNQPDMLTWTVDEQYRKVHDAGGFVVHAHPFRIRSYIKEVRLYPDSVDAIEVINLGNDSPEFNKKAYDYAIKYKLPMTAGTDAHGYEVIHSGMAFWHNIEDSSDFIKELKAGSYQLLEGNQIEE